MPEDLNWCLDFGLDGGFRSAELKKEKKKPAATKEEKAAQRAAQQTCHLSH